MRLRWLVLATTVLVAVTACSGNSVKPTSSGTTGGGGTPTTASAAAAMCTGVTLASPEVGVTPSTITVTVIADTGSPIKPGLFQGSVDAVKAWANYMNDNGGLACRKVVVKSADSKLTAQDAKNAVAAACGDSIALVGTTALFFQDITALQGCKDKAGVAAGIPDLAELQTEASQQCSPDSYAVLPATGTCPYSGTGVRTFTIGATETDYYLKKFGNTLHGVFVVPKDLNSTIAATTPLFAAEQKLGIKMDKEFGESGLGTQADYTPVAAALKQYNSNYARNGLDYSGNVLERKEAQAQGVTSVKVWDCSVQCYDKRLITTGGSAVANQYVWLNLLPLEDKDSNAQLQAMFKYEAQMGKTPDGFGEIAWLAGGIFAQAVNNVVETKGPNALTRPNLIAAIKGIHDFTGGGMMPSTDIGGKKGSTCLVGMQVQGGKFVRIDPTTPGQFDCDNNKTVTVTLDPLKAFSG